MIELRHMDTCRFVIIECRHLAKGCALKCGCIGLNRLRGRVVKGMGHLDHV